LPYIGNIPAEKYAAFNVQYFTTSATDTYTLDRAVANELDIRLVINNVIQEPGSGKAYTAAGTTLTLSAATAGSDTMYCVYIGKAVQTVNPGAGSVGTTALADNAVTEAKLNVSNSPVNGYVLSAQSGAAGGLTWAVDAGGAALTGSTDNTITTVTGANAIQGETNLRFDGTSLAIGNTNFASFDADAKNAVIGTGSGDNGATIYSDGSSSGSIFFANGTAGTQTKQGQIVYEQNNSTMLLKTANATAMSIDGSGDVTQPLQPTFMIAQTGALTVANGHTLFSTNTTERWDVGGNVSGATFTAPVTGKYFLNYNMLYESVSDDSVFEDVIITSNRSYAMWRNSRGYASNASYVYNALSVIADMDANDTAYVQHGGGANGVVHYSNANWPWFQGYLLG